eukprot:863300-Alexandrium_andersonii.AAC.1
MAAASANHTERLFRLELDPRWSLLEKFGILGESLDGPAWRAFWLRRRTLMIAMPKSAQTRSPEPFPGSCCTAVRAESDSCAEA